jgi:hypothetical protein
VECQEIDTSAQNVHSDVYSDAIVNNKKQIPADSAVDEDYLKPVLEADRVEIQKKLDGLFDDGGSWYEETETDQE